MSRPAGTDRATAGRRRLAVIGAGWAGLAAAARAVARGDAVVLYEMAPRPGGRARAVTVDGLVLDNGQHILIGAYVQTLALMRQVGVDPDAVFDRRPLALVGPDGRGLRLPGGPPLAAFARGVLAHSHWRWADRLALLATAAGWAARGFRCDPGWTVARLARGLPAAVRRELIEPLCVAALNTPAGAASAAVFLRMLRDALFSGRGSSDLLLPRVPLDGLLPGPAWAWLAAHGVDGRLGHRVARLATDGGRWRVDDEPFDAVVLACTSPEAARLAREVAPDWAARAAAFQHEPIITVYLRQPPQVRLDEPMVALPDGPDAPAQFVFDLGILQGEAGRFAAVVSGARPWVERGLDATARATVAQLEAAWPASAWPRGATVLRTIAERRATFACRPGVDRPPVRVGPGLTAAGDYVAGPYPSTLEGAVRSGLAAVDELASAP